MELEFTAVFRRATANPVHGRHDHLRVDLRGREPRGVVGPSEEYGELLDPLENDFRQIVLCPTGSRPPPLTIGLEFREVLKVFWLSIATSTAGSLLPSWRATHIPIVDALRHV